MKKNLLGLALLGMIVSSCEVSTDGLEVSSGDIAIYQGETSQIEADAVTEITYDSENEFHAKVSSSGLVTAGRVGETQIIVSALDKEHSVNVEVLPEYTTYTLPILDWDYTRSEIVSELGTPDEDVEDAVVYYNTEEKVDYLMYMFDDNGVLQSSTVILKNQYESELGGFLSERYKLWDESDDLLVFINAFFPADASLAIGVIEFQETHLMVIYQENETTKSASLNVEKATVSAAKFLN